jgi:hypothetical protein
MTKWKVIIKRVVTFEEVVEVEANNDLEAIDKVKSLERVDWNSVIDTKDSVIDIEEVED